jgi:hypothetical protein
LSSVIVIASEAKQSSGVHAPGLLRRFAAGNDDRVQPNVFAL